MQRRTRPASSRADLEKPDTPKTSRPNGAAAGAVAVSKDGIRARTRPELAYAVFGVFIALPAILEADIIPAIILKLALLSVIFAAGYACVTYRRWNDEYAQVPKFVVIFVIMVVELLWENCMVWIVSATDRRKYDGVPPLQDNVEIIFSGLAAKSPAARWALYADWANIKHFLGVLLFLAFSPLFDQTPYSGFGIMSRALLTCSLTRVLRVASFCSTVLPPCWPGCYAARFPPPPEDWWTMVKVGFTTLRGNGGCNDLLFSGHGAFWTLTPLAFQTYYPGRCTWLLWLALAQTSLRDSLEHQHYSVDMLLAPVVTAAVWTWTKRVYPEDAPVAKRSDSAPSDPVKPWVLAVIAVALIAAVIIVIGGKA